MARRKLVTLKAIHKAQKELNLLAASNDNQLQTAQVYKKSCQLDKLIVEYMKHNRQMEIIFPDDPVRLGLKKRRENK